MQVTPKTCVINLGIDHVHANEELISEERDSGNDITVSVINISSNI